MPSLESEFSYVSDMIGQHFVDLDEAVTFLKRNLQDIADGKVAPTRAAKYAREALKGVNEILTPG